MPFEGEVYLIITFAHFKKLESLLKTGKYHVRNSKS